MKDGIKQRRAKFQQVSDELKPKRDEHSDARMKLQKRTKDVEREIPYKIMSSMSERSQTKCGEKPLK